MMDWTTLENILPADREAVVLALLTAATRWAWRSGRTGTRR